MPKFAKLFPGTMLVCSFLCAGACVAPQPERGTPENIREAARAVVPAPWSVTTTIYNDPNGGDVQSIAVGTADGETFAIADIANATGHKLYFRRHDGSVLHNRALISSSFSTLAGAFYLPSVTALDGASSVLVSAKMCVTAAAPSCLVAGLEELEITRSTGVVAAVRRIDANVANVGHGFLHVDPLTSTVYSCWTQAGTGDDTWCNERPLAGAWGAPALVGSGVNTQDHAVLAVDQAGDRVVMWHDAANVGSDLELLHDANPTTFEYGAGDKDNWPHLIESNDVFFAVNERSNGEIGFTSCDAAAEDCMGLPSNPWDANKLVIPGVSDAKKPQIAADSRGNTVVVFEDQSGPTSVVSYTFTCDGGATWSTPVPVSATLNETRVASTSIVVAYPTVVYDLTNDRFSTVFVENLAGHIIGKWSRVPATTLCP